MCGLAIFSALVTWGQDREGYSRISHIAVAFD